MPSRFVAAQTTRVRRAFYSTKIIAVSLQPFVRGLPERLDGVVAVATADVDEAAEFADSRDVSTIPHFIILRDGVQVCALATSELLDSPFDACSSNVVWSYMSRSLWGQILRSF